MVSKNVVLVACSKKKMPVPCKAKDLYRSTWFKLARAYAEKYGSYWYILSAKYGLVDPDDLVHPYDTSLRSMSERARECWAAYVYTQLCPLLVSIKTITLLGGKLYTERLAEVLRQDGIDVRVPLAGMGIGKQQQWLKQQIQKGE